MTVCIVCMTVSTMLVDTCIHYVYACMHVCLCVCMYMYVVAYMNTILLVTQSYVGVSNTWRSTENDITDTCAPI